MSLPIVKLEPHIAGDTFQGIPVIGPFLINGAAPSSPASRARLSLIKVRSADSASLSFDSTAAPEVFPITIVDAANWEFEIPEVGYNDFNLPAGYYEGHLEITDANNVRTTTHEVHLQIKPDKSP